jgi:Tfp pilus assembly protein PilF
MAIITSCIAFGSAALASSNLTAGMNAYNRHDYKTARVSLEKAVKVNPDDAIAHYYLANTLLYLNDREGAKREYRKGLENAESDEIRDNCQSALKSLQRLGQSPAQATAAIKPLTGTTHATEPENTASVLQRQAEERKRTVEQQTENMQKSITQTASERAKAVTEEAKQVTDTTDYTAKAARKARAYYDDINSDAKQRAGQLIKSANQQAATYKQMVNEKNRAYDESVRNLNDQLNSRTGPGGVQLNPNGTSLYVRNYSK